MAFKDNNALKAHLRMHTSDNISKCNVCDKELSSLQGLIHHKKSHMGHMGVKPHQCPICNKSFLSPQNLASHKKKVHT